MTFEEILFESIDEGLNLLGEQIKNAIYLHLRNFYSLSKQDIPYRIEDFTKALEDIFQVGAQLLEVEIMKILYVKVGPGYVPIEKPESLEFLRYVYLLRDGGSCFAFSSASCRPQRRCKV